jgi:putative DNA primase/helicase
MNSVHTTAPEAQGAVAQLLSEAQTLLLHCPTSRPELIQIEARLFQSPADRALFRAQCGVYELRSDYTPDDVDAELSRQQEATPSGEEAEILAEARRLLALDYGTEPNEQKPASRAKSLRFELKRALSKCAPKSYFPLDDIGNGKRFAAMFGHELRFCGVREQWQMNAGGRWKPDDEGVAEQRAKQLAQDFVAEVASVSDEEKRKALLKHALTLTKRSTRETMLRDAASEPGMMVSPEVFDVNVELLNCANGTLDLKTWEFRPHWPDDFLTRQTSVVFDPHAECPTWNKCVAQWMPSEGVADYAQDSAGLSLTGKIYEEFFNLLIGPGDNGKTTFLRTLEQLAGNYWHKTEAETIMLSRDGRKSEAPAPSLLALKGARLVTVHELDSKHKLNAALIKDLTGRDTISARGLFEKRPTNFLPQFTLWAFGNSKPQIGDDSRGMWRRVRIIDFDQVIPPSQRDPDLSTKLTAELSGILNWALDGLRRVQSHGLIVPDAVNVATNAYRAEQDPLAGFLSECCALHPHASANAGELFAAWCAWCRENEEKEGTNKAFATALKSKGFENYRGSDGRRWRGVAPSEPSDSSGVPPKVLNKKLSRWDFIGRSDKPDGSDGANDTFIESEPTTNGYGHD